MKLPTPSKIIDALGGPTKVARLVDRKPPTVCEWREKIAIPPEPLAILAPHIERIFGIPKHVICPKIFDEPIKPKKRKAA